MPRLNTGMNKQAVDAQGWNVNEPLKSRKPSKNVAKENDEVDATDQDFEMFFFGPMRLGDTYSMDDTRRLVENLCDISLWS